MKMSPCKRRKHLVPFCYKCMFFPNPPAKKYFLTLSGGNFGKHVAAYKIGISIGMNVLQILNSHLCVIFHSAFHVTFIAKPWPVMSCENLQMTRNPSPQVEPGRSKGPLKTGESSLGPQIHTSSRGLNSVQSDSAYS